MSELLDALRACGNIEVIRRRVKLVLQALIEAETTEVIVAQSREFRAQADVAFWGMSGRAE